MSTTLTQGDNINYIAPDIEQKTLTTIKTRPSPTPELPCLKQSRAVSTNSMEAYQMQKVDSYHAGNEAKNKRSDGADEITAIPHPEAVYTPGPGSKEQFPSHINQQSTLLQNSLQNRNKAQRKWTCSIAWLLAIIVLMTIVIVCMVMGFHAAGKMVLNKEAR